MSGSAHKQYSGLVGRRHQHPLTTIARPVREACLPGNGSSCLQPTQTGTLEQPATRTLLMPARIPDIALSVKDIDATADLFEEAFGRKRSPKSEGSR